MVASERGNYIPIADLRKWVATEVKMPQRSHSGLARPTTTPVPLWDWVAATSLDVDSVLGESGKCDFGGQLAPIHACVMRIEGIAVRTVPGFGVSRARAEFEEMGQWAVSVELSRAFATILPAALR